MEEGQKIVMPEKPLILIAEEIDPKPLAWLIERANVVRESSDSPNFATALAEAEGLLVRTYTKVTAAFLKYAPKLKVVGRGGVGVDNIDVPACRASGIEVVYTPDANTLSVGDYFFGAVLQLIRPWATFRDIAYSPSEFKRVRNLWFGRQLNELTLGIVGMGRVGRRVGHIAANGFGMHIIYNDLLDVAGQLDFPATAVPLDEVLRAADIFTIHVDMRPGNEHLIGREQIALMKHDALLVDAARGEVLDVHAAADALRNDRLFGVIMDVFDPEPPPADFPLLGLKNVLLTPHMGARTATAMENMSWVVRDVIEVIEGRPAKFPAP